MLELHRVVGNVPSSILAHDQHLAEMRLGLSVAFEAVLIAALFLTDLAVPPQALKPLGLHLVRQVLWRSNYGCAQMSIHKARSS